MSQYQTVKQQIVQTAQDLVRKGYLMATGGNISMRILGQDAFAITPSNYDYMKMTAEDVCILNFDLEILEGERKPSVEAAMHGAIYQVRGDVNADCPHAPGLRQRIDPDSGADPVLVRRAGPLSGAKRGHHPVCALRHRDVEKHDCKACQKSQQRFHDAKPRRVDFRPRYGARCPQCRDSGEVCAGLPAGNLHGTQGQQDSVGSARDRIFQVTKRSKES